MNLIHPRRSVSMIVLVTVSGLLAAGCGASSAVSPASPTTTSTAGATVPNSADSSPPSASGSGSASSLSPVLPIASDPIDNASTVDALQIDSVIVENNVDPATGKTAPDHLEVALSNVGTAELLNIEIYYTFTDTTAGISEGYYTKLPDTFSIPVGGSRVAHFDNSGQPDHFPVNQYSLYYNSTNGLDVEVTVSVPGAAVRTSSVKKDPGGAETAD